MSTRLYVGNLSYQASDDALRSAFAQFGDVVDVHVIIDRYSGRPRGFAFVSMATAEQAARAAAQMNGALFEGRPLKVNEASSRPQPIAAGRR
ncbi:MAG: RNA-binding protein [Polyangiaceae bacterium]|nr:RNA-binding protein [Polyangiaceae bacterium]